MPDRPNAFDPAFLDRFAQDDSPHTAGEAGDCGPWRVEPHGPDRWAVVQDGEATPRAIFHERETALLAAAFYPSEARRPLFLLGPDPEPEGFPVRAFRGHAGLETIGWLLNFESEIVDRLHDGEFLARTPAALALVLEAAGEGALRRAGAILAERLRERRGGRAEAEAEP